MMTDGAGAATGKIPHQELVRNVDNDADLGLKDNKAIAAMFPEEMVRTVNYRITPGTYLRRPTPSNAAS